MTGAPGPHISPTLRETIFSGSSTATDPRPRNIVNKGGSIATRNALSVCHPQNEFAGFQCLFVP